MRVERAEEERRERGAFEQRNKKLWDVRFFSSSAAPSVSRAVCLGALELTAGARL